MAVTEFICFPAHHSLSALASIPSRSKRMVNAAPRLLRKPEIAGAPPLLIRYQYIVIVDY
jgi:hypothetical protein